MTNVKLKLMFFLLNALLTADIVHARPYSDNTTDIVIKYNSTDFNLPVKSNSDTLIVAQDETPEETNRNSNNHMEAIMTAERDRDQDLSKKVMKENTDETPESDSPQNSHMEDIMTAERDRDEDLSQKVMKDNTDETPESDSPRNPHMEDIMNAEKDRDQQLAKKVMKEHTLPEIPKKDASAIEKQLNISSSLLEDIIDSETDREETLTDILFRPASELADAPKFEFLIAAKINETDVKNNSSNTKGGISDNSLDNSNRNGSDVVKKVDYVELVELLKSKDGENKSAYSLGNITGHEVDDDLAPDTRFTDMQTLLLACFGTLIPLLGVLFATLFIRCLYRRYCLKPTVVSESDSSEKQDDNHQQLKSPAEDGGSGGEVVENGSGPPSNGSIFTMTLKNNHLIVETEERNDFTKNGRETKMKYSPDNDGIFVVEVQQSTAYRPNNKSLQNSPPHDPQISTNQALIHRVPEELDRKNIEEDSERSSGRFDREKALALSSTGLSISDLSMSSIGSHNVSYSYGSQMGYEQGPFGYPVYAGYDITKEDSSDGIIHDNSQEPLISKTPTDPYKPVVTAAIFKQDSIIGSDALQGPGYCIEGSSDGPLLSDVQAREVSLQNLHDKREKKLENGVAVPISEKIESSKNPLNRADSLPVRLEEEKPSVVDKNNAMDTIKENDSKDEVPSKDALKGKRASLPLIRTDVYETVKDVILATGSPKFEKLTNDVSPGESNFDAPPMITITEECESGKSDSTS